MPLSRPARLRALIPAVSLLFAAAASQAAEGDRYPRPAPVDVPHVQAQIKVDGVLDEPVWQQARKVDLGYEIRPGENTPASVKTTAYIAENGEHLLLAFVAEDPDPKQIRAFLRDRDSAYNDDFVGIILDTFDDTRRAYEFFVNPLGAQMDLIQDDNTGNEDDSWDGLWESQGRITDTGYVVEIEIPFSTLRFHSSADVQNWGARFLRIRPRDQRYQLADHKSDRNIPCYLCQFGRLRGFAGIHPGSNFEINPTVTTRFTQLRDGPGQDFHSDGLKFDPGIDIKWAPSPNMTLNAAVNPDFSQVEADSAQLDVNNTFALYFPEKRPFFQEGADYFNTPNTLVYTRNVNDPDLGLRVTGRSGGHTYGVFVARDTVTDLLLPSARGSSLTRYDGASNDGAFRYRYDISNGWSVGAAATVRRGDDYNNQLEAVDSRWQKGAHTLVGQWITTRTHDPARDEEHPAHDSEGDAYSFEYDYETRNWFGFVLRNHFDPGFRADLGFIGQVGYDQTGIGITRHWWKDSSALFNHITLNARWFNNRETDGTLLEIIRESWVGVNGPLQSYLEFGHVERHREWEDFFFDERINRVRANFKPMRGVAVSFFARHGSKVDLANAKLGTITTISPDIDFNLGRSLTLSISHNYERLSRDGGDVYEANLTDLRLSYQFNLRQRLRLALLRNDLKVDPFLYAQPEKVSDHYRSLNTQLIYSYKINPRTALYAGYADGYTGGNFDSDGDELPDYQQSLYQTDRTLFVKLGYAWEL